VNQNDTRPLRATELDDRISLAADPSKISPNRPGPQAAFALNFRLYRKNSLLAFFDLELSSGLILRGCQLHESHGKRWVGCPPAPMRQPTARNHGLALSIFATGAPASAFKKWPQPPPFAYERIRGAA
jgi:hypothetical protein